MLEPARFAVVPQDCNLKNVKAYGAKGDGVTDDTAAILRALWEGRTNSDGTSKKQDYNGRPKGVFFPAGVYLVSNLLTWYGCAVSLQGEGSDNTIIRLKDNCLGYTDAETPKAVIATPRGNMSFRQYVRDLTVDVGNGNPGAIGIDYISNNVGAIRNVKIIAGDNSGLRGLSMTREYPGPSLIKGLRVVGFDTGIKVACPEYGVVLENIQLEGQRSQGIANFQNTLAIRGLTSRNTCPAISNQMRGFVILHDSEIDSRVENMGDLYVRNVKGLDDTPEAGKSLNLPIEETPEYAYAHCQDWAKWQPRWLGETGSLRKAMNAGKPVIYFRFGAHLFFNQLVVDVPAGVRHIIGYNVCLNGKGVLFRVAEPTPEPLIIEQFGYGVSVSHDCDRTVVLKDGKYGYSSSPNAGKLFLENVGMKALYIPKGRKVWARQLNIESKDTMIRNDGGQLWILGLKTELPGTVIETRNGGQTEMLGTVIYPASDVPASRVAFISTDSEASLSYSLSVYKGQNYRVQIRDVKNGMYKEFTFEMTGNRIVLYSNKVENNA